MKGKNILVIGVLILFLLLASVSNTKADVNDDIMSEQPKIQSTETAFDHIYGSPGYTALAVSEDDNSFYYLILAFIIDDFLDTFSERSDFENIFYDVDDVEDISDISHIIIDKLYMVVGCHIP